MKVNRHTLFPIIFLASTPAVGLTTPPPQALNVGYILNTFSSTFSKYTVDKNSTGKSGFLWYTWNIFGSKTNQSKIELNSNDSVTLLGDTTGPNGELTTASSSRDPEGFVGKAFGGGAYIEAEIKFDPNSTLDPNGCGWPSFWSLPIESSILEKNQWAGQTIGYIHSVEADFLEYMPSTRMSTLAGYGTALHDWYGIPNITCSKGLCQASMTTKNSLRIVPLNTDFNEYHRYGFLWVKATSNQKGYAKFYFDDEQVGPTQEWDQFNNQPPPPNDQSWAFSIIDKMHLILILGTGPSRPMTIKTVNVWQKDSSQNLSR